MSSSKARGFPHHDLEHEVDRATQARSLGVHRSTMYHGIGIEQWRWDLDHMAIRYALRPVTTANAANSSGMFGKSGRGAGFMVPPGGIGAIAPGESDALSRGICAASCAARPGGAERTRGAAPDPRPKRGSLAQVLSESPNARESSVFHGTSRPSLPNLRGQKSDSSFQ